MREECLRRGSKKEAESTNGGRSFQIERAYHRNSMVIGADCIGATGAFAPVLARVLGREYSFAPVPFEYYIYMYMRIFRRPLPIHSDFCANVSSR